MQEMMSVANNLFYDEIKSYYKNDRCPICKKNPLSHDKHHIFPEAVFKRLSDEKMFIFSDEKKQSEFENKIGHARLKNGLWTKGLWCEKCEKSSSVADNKFINFLDHKDISEAELINFIRLLYLRFCLFLIKPHTNKNTEFLADLFKYLKIPSQYFVDALLYKRHHILGIEQYPIILVCKINNLPFRFSFPQLHYRERLLNERACLVIDNLFFQIFPGSQNFNFDANGPRFDKYSEYNRDHPLNLANFILPNNPINDNKISTSKIPAISKKQFDFLWIYQ